MPSHRAIRLPLFHLWQEADMKNDPIHGNALTTSLSKGQAYELAQRDGFALSDCPIDDRLLKSYLLNDSAGALVTFEGWVRNHNNKRAVSHLIYYGYEQLAINHGAKLVSQAKSKFDITHAVAIHRIGKLDIGDMAVWIGVTASHRTPAFAACEWLLNAIKADIPVWKQEFYDDDSSLWLSNNG